MISVLSRCISIRRLAHIQSSLRSYSNFQPEGNRSSQIEYILSIFEKKSPNWIEVKENVLQYNGDTNIKNFEGMLLKMMKSRKKFELALSFADHLKSSNNELSLGATNGILALYYEISLTRPLNDKERSFILETHENLYKKYKVLDSVTCDKLIHALCAINEVDKAIKVLDNIYLVCTPSHSAYSTIIATLFKNDKSKEALKLIEVSLNNKRPLLDIAYEEWINYYLRKYTRRDTIVKYLETILEHISMHFGVISNATANKLRDTFMDLNWKFTFTKIRKNNGECTYCKTKLASLDLDKKEFAQLQKIIKEKIIVGSDLFLKTSPEELNRFQKFLNDTAPYDVVLDALNISYTVQNIRNQGERFEILKQTVDYFSEKNKKILLLGRKHMLRGNYKILKYLSSKTCSFFTEDITQDDPFFITAAIISGPNTDIVSKDLLRGHRFLLKDQQLRLLFQRWQWQHQWMVYNTRNNGLYFQAPLSFTPCAQKNGDGWHLPYEREDASNYGNLRDNIPDLSSWICLKPKLKVTIDNKIFN